VVADQQFYLINLFKLENLNLTTKMAEEIDGNLILARALKEQVIFPEIDNS
jgi:hypothetical protein